MAQNLDTEFPALSDLRHRAQKRIPHFAFEYLDSATGREIGAHTKRLGLDAIQFMPGILKGEQAPDLTTRLWGRIIAIRLGLPRLACQD